MATKKEILIRAKEILDKNWIAGSVGLEEDDENYEGMCFIGALATAVNPEYFKDHRDTSRAIDIVATEQPEIAETLFSCLPPAFQEERPFGDDEISRMLVTFNDSLASKGPVIAVIECALSKIED